MAAISSPTDTLASGTFSLPNPKEAASVPDACQSAPGDRAPDKPNVALLSLSASAQRDVATRTWQIQTPDGARLAHRSWEADLFAQSACVLASQCDAAVSFSRLPLDCHVLQH